VLIKINAFGARHWGISLAPAWKTEVHSDRVNFRVSRRQVTVSFASMVAVQAGHYHIVYGGLFSFCLYFCCFISLRLYVFVFVVVLFSFCVFAPLFCICSFLFYYTARSLTQRSRKPFSQSVFFCHALPASHCIF